VRKWLRRYAEEGMAGLADRGSRPHRLHRPVRAATVERIAELRRQRWTGRQIDVALDRLRGQRQPGAQTPPP
jgi:transposase